MSQGDKLKVIQIESTSRCNARCVMCPHGAGTLGIREPHFNEELFTSILIQARHLQVETITPFLTGELLVFPRWKTWMQKIREAGFGTFVYTNGALLTPETIEFFRHFPNIRQFVVSHHATTPETEKAMTGLSYSRIEQNICTLLSVELPFPVELHFVQTEHNKHEADEFLAKWGSVAKVIPFYTYGGKIHDNTEDMTYPQKPCTRLLSEMTVLSNGKVSLCCLDGSGDVILGDLNEESVESVWLRAKTLRDRHRAYDFDMELCRECNMNRIPPV